MIKDKPKLFPNNEIPPDHCPRCQMIFRTKIPIYVWEIHWLLIGVPYWFKVAFLFQSLRIFSCEMQKVILCQVRWGHRRSHWTAKTQKTGIKKLYDFFKFSDVFIKCSFCQREIQPTWIQIDARWDLMSHQSDFSPWFSLSILRFMYNVGNNGITFRNFAWTIIDAKQWICFLVVPLSALSVRVFVHHACGWHGIDHLILKVNLHLKL